MLHLSGRVCHSPNTTHDRLPLKLGTTRDSRVVIGGPPMTFGFPTLPRALHADALARRTGTDARRLGTLKQYKD